MYLFNPQDVFIGNEYAAMSPLNEVMSVHSTGIVTARDSLTMHWTRAEAWQTVNDFAAMDPETARAHYGLGPDSRDWTVQMAQDDLRASGMDADRLCQVLYRPFDLRWTYFTGHSRGFHCTPRGSVMEHMIAGHNIGLCSNRQVNGEFRHAGVSRAPIDTCALSLATREGTYLHPLWIYPHRDVGLLPSERHPNLSDSFLRELALSLGLPQVQPFGMPKNIMPDDVRHYMLAVLQSSTYRSRYAAFLKNDFPRLPSTPNPELFRALTRAGSDLAALQLLESPRLEQPITESIGSRNPIVERISWTRDTVWVDKAQTSGFTGVPESVWNFHLGGYQVCEKWLKDRKGRTLSDEDIAHYQKIVVALLETIRLMKEIDEVIEHHGGWPGAFSGEKAAN